MIDTAIDDVKRRAAERIRANADDLLALSHRIHGHPELRFAEYRAAKWCSELLSGAGLPVSEGVYGLPTAFEAKAGSGPYTIAVCCEYDALPEIGHACGHNIIAAAGVGAGIGIASVASELGICVKVLGTPAEEEGGGKVELLDAGALRGVDAAMMVHPGPHEGAAFRSFASATFDVTFTGRAAHAAQSPADGLNAADAMTIAQVAIGLLRQQLPKDHYVHGVVTRGGEAHNIIPAVTTAKYGIRTLTAESLSALRERVLDCFRAGALATGCELAVSAPSPDYLDFRDDARLVELYAANANALGRPKPAPAFPFASTDMANVSHVVPSIHPMLDIEAEGASPHQKAFAEHCVGQGADRAVIEGAIAMAWTAIDVGAERAHRLPVSDPS